MYLEKLNQHRRLVFVGLTVVGFLLFIGIMFSVKGAGLLGFTGCGLALITVLGVRDVLWQAGKPDERQNQLREVAQEIKFTFTDQADHNPFGLPESFLLTQQGVKTEQAIEEMMISSWLAFALPKFRNLFQRTMDGMTISVFDYEFSEGDDSGSNVRQTVFALASADLDRPHLALCPATSWDRIAAKVKSSIQIEHGYRFTFDEDNSVLAMTDELIELLDGATCIEVGEGHLLMYRCGVLAEPYQIDSFIKEGLLVYSTVSDATEKSAKEVMLVD